MKEIHGREFPGELPAALKEESLTIRVFPDPILKIPATPVERFDDRLASFVDRMRLAMELHDGVGLAAPQVGVSKRIALVSFEGVLYVLINPVLLGQEGEQEGEEGCLSFPGIYAAVKRPASIRVTARDLTGEERLYEPEGFLARAFLHEMDHLDGRLFIEYLSNLKRGMIRKKMYKRAVGEDE
ncbi:MAG: peptide deformylase [Synergistaceae bacterium]|jgi:peptide deformylase|nr:peptide deformylase [Synergistaceae bacterium]